MTMTAQELIALCQAGHITETYCHAQLDNLQVRGGFDEALNYTGYDYRNQTWITEGAAEIKTELTEIGEQYVVPGAERKFDKADEQIELW